MADHFSLDDVSLVAQIAQQTQDALSTLYDRYANVIYAMAYRSLGSIEDAEEITIDVFSQVWRIADRYDASKSRVDSWLFMLARSRVLDRLRQRQRRDKVGAASTLAAKNHPAQARNDYDPVNDAVILERRDYVLTALERLPPEQRLVVELAYYQGLTQREIADRTGASLGTVKTRIRLGLSKLKYLLGEWQ